jgi:hypothetical protein
MLGIAFMLLTIWSTLYADWEARLEKVFEAHGFLNFKGTVSLLAGILITLIASIMIIIYEKLLWRYLCYKSYRGGWWLYALVDDDATKAQPIVGFFRIKHSLDRIQITNAHCFYYDGSNAENHLVKERGFWSADLVMISEDEMQLVYEMPNAEAPPNGTGFLPNHYIGYMELTHHGGEQDSIFGNSPHGGLIIEVSRQHDHGGIMYCERLKQNVLRSWGPKTLVAALQIYSPKLVKRTLARRDAELGHK